MLDSHRLIWPQGLATLLIYLISAVVCLSWPSSVAGISHLYLPCGFGLACVLAWGRWMAVPVGLGSAAVVWGWTAWYTPDALAWSSTGLLCLASGVGGGLQAWLAARLTQGPRSDPAMALDSMSSIARFFVWAGPVACLVNAGLSTSAMVHLGVIPATAWPTVAGTWWAGDTVGVLLGAPMMLTLIGKPRALWQQRRMVVGIPLLVATMLMGAGIGLVQRWEHDKEVLEFRRQAEATASSMRAQMHDYLDTLETLRGLFDASEHVTREEFHRACVHWLNHQPGVMALGWSEQVGADQLNMFEQQTRAEGLRQFQVFDLPGRQRTRSDAVVVRYIEPMVANHQALGYNLLSNPAARQALEQASLHDAPVGTALLAPDQAHTTAADSTAQGVWVYRTVQTSELDAAAATPSPAKGVVFAVLRLDRTLQEMMREAPAFMRACLRDVTDGPSQLLAGSPGCAARADNTASASRPVAAFGQHSFSHEVMLPAFGQRQWVLTLWADQDHSLGGWTVLSLLFALAGVMLSAALGSLLLVITGHADRMNSAMTEARRQRLAAEEASKAKSEFLSRMSHELRTPLNAMLGFAQVMELDQTVKLNDTQRSRLDQIQQAGWHLLDMIDDVLDISSIDTGAMPLQEVPLSVETAVGHSLATVEPLREQHGVHITTKHLLQSGWGVLADPSRLQQILDNLLSNAVKYNKPGGRVHVLTSVTTALSPSRKDDMLARPMIVMTFTDTGQGMSAEQLAQLFQPFNRLGRAQGAEAGMGVGLVISRHLAQLMGGTLEATSQLGKGSVFTLSLPAAEMPVTHPSAATSANPDATTASSWQTQGKKHVLYVEDNAVNSAVMQAIMRERPQISLQISGTIETGLATLHDRTRGPKPDLILLDVHLPDASGLDLLQLIKANPDTQDIPVVMISADAMPEQIDACLRAGAACYLTKPIQIRVLLQQIDDLLM